MTVSRDSVLRSREGMVSAQNPRGNPKLNPREYWLTNESFTSRPSGESPTQYHHRAASMSHPRAPDSVRRQLDDGVRGGGGCESCSEDEGGHRAQ